MASSIRSKTVIVRTNRKTSLLNLLLAPIAAIAYGLAMLVMGPVRQTPAR